MILLCILIALLLLQSSSITSCLHKDQWFYGWLDWLNTKVDKVENTVWFSILAVALPLFVLSISLAILAKVSFFLVFVVSIAFLLYSFGRGDWSNSLSELKSAYMSEDVDVTYQQIGDWLPTSYQGEGSWRQQAVVGVIYSAFERTFVVLFWFLLLGPIGAVAYRLIALLQNYQPPKNTSRYAVENWRWLLEWPAVRLLGLSFALVGNFSGCYHQWKICALCTHRKTHMVLFHYIQGALMSYKEQREHNVDNSAGVEDFEIDINVVDQLYRRALILWVCILAIFWII